MNNTQQRILDVLKFTLSFFEKHNLKYVACAGTVLGAMRHGGFIPWDDDVDLYMPRNDYNRLLSLGEEIKKEGYDIVSYADKGYFLPFCKIMDTKSTLWGNPEVSFVFGYFVDVFPLDFSSASDEALVAMQIRADKLFYKYALSVCHFSVADFFNYLCHRDFHKCAEIVENWLISPFSKMYLKRFLDDERKYAGGQGEKCLCVCQVTEKIYPRSWIDNPVEMDFEDIRLKVPSHTDEYLTLLYGNWKEFPPVEQRKGHRWYYVNPDKKLSIDVVKNIIRKKRK